jgi:metacaspase-1
MVQIINAGTTVPLGEPIDIDLNLSTVKTRIENYTKSKFLLSFNPESSGLEARLEIVPATSNFLKDTISIDKFIENGVITMDTNTSFFLKVVNESDQKIYYNIVDIDAENWISVVLPDSEDSNGDDYWVEPLSETIVSRDNVKLSFQAIPPFGSETMKLFISDMPIDLRGLSNQKSRSLNPNPLSALEKIFDFSGKKGTRSIEPSYSNKFKATSYSLNFQIVPAN